MAYPAHFIFYLSVGRRQFLVGDVGARIGFLRYIALTNSTKESKAEKVKTFCVLTYIFYDSAVVKWCAHYYTLTWDETRVDGTLQCYKRSAVHSVDL